ncbi:type II toxin-antitoxin system RelE/ParE family toxin [Methanolobus zinderi]|uniref:Type II toxin-antitoxin system RelE/ParE family toxin n=1 Tax=Methanolobus zinderi TaxID=536044 RepID=A0A7D5E8Z7_9EURY|nr:type II toxin-antitoxin system RelE/ParE family toxin [Methanolobus zinderi]QLC50838.1 type II toxin-antitoxin system RelE/ParE family toxin [Methanolobus zinderi]
MTYNIIFSENAKKQFQKLEQNVQKRIIASLERIRIRPESYISKLVGDPGYKYRVGDYRIILDLDNENLYILVIKIGHRKKIYKR